MTEDELRKNMEERIKEIENDKLRQINEKMKILEEDKLKSVDKINNLSKEISRIKQENLDIKVIPLQLCNGWRNLEREFGYGKIIKKGNEITLSGVLTGQMYKPICILPEDCRPKKQLIFTLNHQDGILRFDVYPNGTVAYCAGTPKYEWVSLEGIHYFVGI